MTELVVLILLVALGAWSALDGVSLGQIMVSRPLVSGTLAGWILGDPATGLAVGGILEAAHLGTIPAGGAKLPEPGPAAIPGVFGAVLLGGTAGIAVGAGIGAALSLLGGSSVVMQRRVNGALTRGVELGAFHGSKLAVRHWLCIGIDGLRGATLTGIGLFVAWLLPATAAERWTVDGSITPLILLLPGAVAAGALLRSWTAASRRMALYLVGVLGGWLLAFSL